MTGYVDGETLQMKFTDIGQASPEEREAWLRQMYEDELPKPPERRVVEGNNSVV